MELRDQVPVGHGQSRKAYLLTRAALFEEALGRADLRQALRRHQLRNQLLPDPDRLFAEEARARPRSSPPQGGGKPTDPFAAYLGQLNLGWVILAARDAEAKEHLSETTASSTATSRPEGDSPTRPTSDTSSTSGWAGRTTESTAPPNR
ncbi:MAG: hypothetical protein IPK93_10425 [Solirubrobacterales bacterium]|nr:hypothetical protein [Solirubrobacterales bacterium]